MGGLRNPCTEPRGHMHRVPKLRIKHGSFWELWLGGLKKKSYFHLENWGRWFPLWRLRIFFQGVVQPPTRWHFFDIFISNCIHKIPFLYPVVIIIVANKNVYVFSQLEKKWRLSDLQVHRLVNDGTSSVFFASCRSLRSPFGRWKTPNHMPDALNVSQIPWGTAKSLEKPLTQVETPKNNIGFNPYSHEP